jgi:hypothetical protein
MITRTFGRPMLMGIDVLAGVCSGLSGVVGEEVSAASAVGGSSHSRYATRVDGAVTP